MLSEKLMGQVSHVICVRCLQNFEPNFRLSRMGGLVLDNDEDRLSTQDKRTLFQI